MQELIVLTGPTGIGKTDLSIELAQKMGLEIISSDSRQIYKHMTIGTAKITPGEMNGVKHHLVDFVDIDQDYNAFDFATDAKKVISEKPNKMIVGGTLFYIDALVNESLIAPKCEDSLKVQLEEEYDLDPNKLHAELKAKDEVAGEKIHVNDKYRVVRAMSVIRTTGKPYSSFKQKSRPRYAVKYLVLSMDRGKLYDRINRRVDVMVESGLFDEVQSILDMGYQKDLKALNTLGYKEVIEYFEMKITKDECIDKIKQESRHFAKRQITWLRSLNVDFMTHDEVRRSI
jgi:tRNA dimethylallyltransferase